MTPERWVFLVVAAVIAIASIRLVTTKNVVHGALYLVVALAGAAVIFLLFLAEFVAWAQVLIYVGAVVILLLFGLMLTRAPIGRTALDNEQRPLAALIALAIFSVTSSVLYKTFQGRNITFHSTFATGTIGTVIFTRYVFPFEVASFVLLAALVGAVVLAKRD